MGAVFFDTCSATTGPSNQINKLDEMRQPLRPLSAADEAALVRLCEVKKVIRRADGYGSETETLISSASAVVLKKRKLAVTGWSREMYPTQRGHAFAQSNIA